MPLDALFDPAGIAVVGASRTAGKLGHEAMRNAVAFDGPVTPVNPSAEGDLFGEPVVADVADVPHPVDLALVCVPAPAVPGVVRDCGAAGVGAAVVYSGGFAEAGPEGEALQAALREAAAAHDVTVLGPNTSGFLVPRRRLRASFVSDVDRVGAGSVAVVAQSGGIAHALAFQAAREGHGLAAMVGLGNRVTTGFQPVVEHLDADPATDAIVLHVEGVDDARGLLSACEAAETPVVSYDVGKTDVGDFAASHTGALTGDWARYEGGFAQHGVPTVGSTTALLDAGRALATGPRPSGPNAGVVTVQAGPGIAIEDRLNDAGVPLPGLAPETADRLDDLLPGLTYVGNPVDTGRPTPEFPAVVEAVAADPGVDVLCLYELLESAIGYPTDALRAVVESGVPTVVATDGPEPEVGEALAPLADAGVITVRTPERGADATAALVEWWRLNRGRAPGTADREPGTADREPGTADREPGGEVAAAVAAAVDEARAAGDDILVEPAAKDLLARLGVDVPPHRVVDSPAAAVEAAGDLGYPVVAKVSSPAVTHASDWADGAGVALDLADAAAVLTAARSILDALETRGLEGRILVEPAVDGGDGTELLVGGSRDDSFGPTVLAGLGGVHAEALDDVAHRLAPLTTEQARSMLGDLRAAPLLEGGRGRPPVDRDAVAEVIVAVGDLLAADDRVREVDVNPVLAGSDRAVALDAHVVLDGTEG